MAISCHRRRSGGGRNRWLTARVRESVVMDSLRQLPVGGLGEELSVLLGKTFLRKP